MVEPCKDVGHISRTKLVRSGADFLGRIEIQNKIATAKTTLTWLQYVEYAHAPLWVFTNPSSDDGTGICEAENTAMDIESPL
jgi:hypothetical protein